MLKFILFLFFLRFSKSTAIDFNKIKTEGSTNIDSIILKSDEMSNTKKNNEHNYHNALLVFISSSMPEKMITDYFKESSGKNIIFVLRGFYKDSFSETTNKYRKLQGNIPVNLIIEPRLFEKYEITQAPTFVFQDKKNAYKKLSGAVSINFVFEKFKEETK